MNNTLTTQDNPHNTTLTKKDMEATRFATEYIKHHHNGTRAMLTMKPHLTEASAAVEASTLLKTVKVQEELKRVNNELEVQAIRTKAEIITNMERIGGKAEKSKGYTPALNAWKEIGILSGAYDKDGDDHASYSTFINNLTVNMAGQTQHVVGDSDKPVDIEAEWEETLNNQEVSKED